MASEQLLKFNEQFPDSLYREIHAQYTGPMKSDEDLKKYQKSKAPINTATVPFEKIKDTKNRIGWIVPEDYIVVDIDKQEYASVVFKILKRRVKTGLKKYIQKEYLKILTHDMKKNSFF